MEKVTKRDMFTTIMTAMSDNEDVVAFCEKEIAALDKKALKARERAAVKKTVGDELRDRVQAVLTSDPMTIADIVDAIADDEVTASKVIYRCNALVSAGIAEKGEVKLEGKKSAVKTFWLA